MTAGSGPRHAARALRVCAAAAAAPPLASARPRCGSWRQRFLNGCTSHTDVCDKDRTKQRCSGTGGMRRPPCPACPPLALAPHSRSRPSPLLSKHARLTRTSPPSPLQPPPKTPGRAQLLLLGRRQRQGGRADRRPRQRAAQAHRGGGGRAARAAAARRGRHGGVCVERGAPLNALRCWCFVYNWWKLL